MAIDWDVIDESTRVFQCRLDYDDRKVLATVTWKIGESEVEVKLGSGYGEKEKTLTIGEVGILSAFLAQVGTTIEAAEAELKAKADAEVAAQLASEPPRGRKRKAVA